MPFETSVRSYIRIRPHLNKTFDIPWRLDFVTSCRTIFVSPLPPAGVKLNSTSIISDLLRTTAYLIVTHSKPTRATGTLLYPIRMPPLYPRGQTSTAVGLGLGIGTLLALFSIIFLVSLFRGGHVFQRNTDTKSVPLQINVTSESRASTIMREYFEC